MEKRQDPNYSAWYHHWRDDLIGMTKAGGSLLTFLFG